MEELQKKSDVMDDDEVSRKINEYQSVYSDHNFSEVYDLKYDLKNTILNVNEDAMKKVIAAGQYGNRKFSDTKKHVKRCGRILFR